MIPEPYLPQPLRWLALDIETTHARPEEAERHLRLHFNPPSNMKTPEAIGRRFLEMAASRQEKRALLESAPIVIVSTCSTVERRLLHCLREEAAHQRADGSWVEGFADRRAMLLALRFGLDALVGDDTELVGHNIRSFDLVRLRWSYVREGLRIPRALAREDQPVFDTMREFGRRFSSVDKPFVALADLLEEFGLPNHKGEMDGSMVPEYVEAGRVEELVDYALKDAAIEAELYLRMTGQHEDAEVAS